VTYNWDFGDGSTGAGANPVHAYTSGGVFSVTLTVTNSKGCTYSVVQNNLVTVYPKPVSTVSAAQTTICTIPGIARFSASSNTGVAPYSYVWDFGDGTATGTGAGPTHTYATAGQFTVRLYTTDSRGCVDTLIKTAYIETLPNTASFDLPQQGCQGSYVIAKNTTTNGSLTEWLFGDGTATEYGDSLGHVYTQPGIYTVRMVTVVGNCSDTVRKNIVINPKPKVTMTHDLPCPGPTTMTFNANSTIPGTTYGWRWSSDGRTGTGSPISRPYATSPLIDSTIVIGTSPAGCKDTFIMDTTYVRDLTIEWKFYPDPPKGCAPLKVEPRGFVGTSLPCRPLNLSVDPNCPYPAAVTSWAWSIDGVPTYNVQYPSHIFTTPGRHLMTVTVVTANGCTHTEDIPVLVGEKIKPSFTVSKDTACPSQPIFFTNTTGIDSLIYKWEYGEGGDTGVNGKNGKHRYTSTGWHTVTLTSDNNGCLDTFKKINAIYTLPGNAVWEDSLYCAPSKTAFFKDKSTGATTHIWDFGDGSPQVNTPSATHTFPGFGSYWVTKFTTSSISGCKDTMGDSIRIRPLILDLFASDTALCLRDTLHLIPKWNTELTVTTWRIVVNGHRYESDPKYITPYPIDTVIMRTGYDTVSFVLVTRDGMCRDSIVKNNYVIISQPVAGFNAGPIIGCKPMLVTFNDTSSFTTGTQVASRWWSFGEGGILTNNNKTSQHLYDTAGKFDVKLVVTDWNGCKDSVTKSQHIDVRHPSANFTTSVRNACKNSSVSFNNLSNGATALNTKWFFGDGDTSRVYHPTHTYKDTGTFTVMLVVWDSTGCRDTMIRQAGIHVTSPTAGFTLSDTVAVCPPLTVKFTNASVGASRYEWSFGNAGTAVLADPVSTYSANGLFNVRLVAIDANGCTDTAYSKVRVLGYAGAFNYTPLLGCAPLTVNFISTVWNVPSLIWDFADGSTLAATASTTSHVYTTPGHYVPKLLFSDGKGCISSSDGLDTIKVDGVKAGFTAVPPCEKTPLQLFDTSKSYFSQIITSRWDFGSSGIITGNPVTRQFNTAGEYPVMLVSTNANGCVDTLRSTIRVYPLPKIVATDDTAVCPPDAITLSVTGGKTYAWSPAAGLSCTACANPVVTTSTPSYWVVAGTDAQGCTNRDTVWVRTQTKATFKVAGGGAICLGESFRLKASGATLYSWTPAQDLDSPGTAAPLASPKQNTTYVVTGREGSCIPDTHQVRIVVNPLPTVDAGGELKVIAGNEIQLQASGTGIQTVSWDTDETLSCHQCFAPYAKPRQNTTYRITALNEFGCKATDSVRVLVLCNGSQLFLPNTFTPNSDGQNDNFYPQGVGIEKLNYFRIYSRWGELLYEKTNMPINDEFAGWNGTHNGAKLNPDVYVYILEARCDTGEPLVLKGDVTLIR
jgi:gliding motility-associated-like protein